MFKVPVIHDYPTPLACARVVREARAAYKEDEESTLRAALEILGRRVKQSRNLMTSPDLVKQYVRAEMANLMHERFDVILLDAKIRLIAHVRMFEGTLTHTSVYPREVLKLVMGHHASAVLLLHCHPSGVADASEADLKLTRTLTQTLDMVDVKVLDHFVVAGTQVYSFAEHGQI